MQYAKSVVGTVPPEEENELLPIAGSQAWDDVTGLPLHPQMVRQARSEHIACYKKMQVFEKVLLEECWTRTGKAPIKVRWADVDKHKGEGLPKYRSRLVACHYNTGPNDGTFAATSPIESLNTVISNSTTGERGKGILACDVSRAYFYAPVEEDIFVELCNETRSGPGDHGRCGTLKMAMYGTRSAANSWQKQCGRTLREAGVQGTSNPCLFSHSERGLCTCARRRLCFVRKSGRLQMVKEHARETTQDHKYIARKRS